jgi:hypothetical protein
MIIKPACEREYVPLPNAIANDKRLSAETRGMLLHLIAKPPGWEVRPTVLARKLCVGLKKLKRMLREAGDAGYIWRSPKQRHNPNGSWGRFEYIVGMPDDVAKEVAARGVAISPQRLEAHAPEASAQKEQTDKVLNQSHKTKKDINSPLAPRERTKAPMASEEDIADYEENVDDYERAARANGCKFAYVGSKPYKAWCEYQRVHGLIMPQLRWAIVDGERRRGVWFETLYPPGYDPHSAAG